MLVRQNVVLSIFLGVVVLPKSSQQRKPEDQCIKGKEYLSTTLFGDKHRTGTCVSCPRHWTICDQQPTGDKERCEKSCRVKLKPTKSNSPSKVIPSSSYIPIIKHSKALQNASIYSSAAYPARSTQYQKHSTAIYDHLWIVVLLLSVILVLVILLITIAVVLFLRNRRKVGYRDQGVATENPLQEFPENVAVSLLQSEDFEQRGQRRGDTEQGVQVERIPESERHGGERRLPQSSSEEERQQPSRTQQRLKENRLPEVVEGRFPGPEVECERSPESNGGEECLREANDAWEQSHEPDNGDENVEKRSPFQGTAFSLRIGGIQEESNGKGSSLHVNEIHT